MNNHYVFKHLRRVKLTSNKLGLEVHPKGGVTLAIDPVEGEARVALVNDKDHYCKALGRQQAIDNGLVLHFNTDGNYMEKLREAIEGLPDTNLLKRKLRKYHQEATEYQTIADFNHEVILRSANVSMG